ncbi:DUF4355 domain-containing protein [Desulforamulus aeronauticus]|uniref:DUF4355 domain-containing protein n=1 Tax=Desulforamulus aeronauticus DSM 10349 TaxID=1121421 RepID=A0A1M6SBL7_9FIRM|nr:DUF4355 domain-containing protein [Desulforamulus aeronauticus]SHK42172.1 protein of unknown function [Desulforamulus aeronauticus DSM 10349]
MDLQEIKAYFQTNKDNEDIKNYLSELSKVTTEGVDQFVATEEGKKWLGKHNDSFFTRGLESWKKNNLEKLIFDEVAKANPQETPEQKKIRELEERLNQKEAQEKRQSLLNKSLLIADQKKLPKDILEFFLGDSEESTIKNLDSLEGVFSKHVEALVNERMNNGNYTPPNDAKGNDIKTIQETFRSNLG